jgi:uncharacterized SAM-binding protein YcdF (DUF218 family)
MKLLTRIAAIFGLFIAAILILPVLNPWIRALSAPWSDAPGDTLIVLGNDSTEGGILGLGSYWRSVYAVLEWRTEHYREIVISGAEVAGPMRDFIVSQGVPATSIRVETRSRNTRENAMYVAEMLRGTRGKKVLLTSDYHSFRAARAFQKAGLEVIPRPFPDAGKQINSRPMRIPVFVALSTETAKIIWYRLRGWI